jgi:hypothetical protein
MKGVSFVTTTVLGGGAEHAAPPIEIPTAAMPNNFELRIVVVSERWVTGYKNAYRRWLSPLPSEIRQGADLLA